jgi:tagatose 1,6-diphosphate aldolase GatY/KbaY
MITSARDMLSKAAREGYCVGAFNVTNIIQMEGVVEAAEEERAPLIVQTSLTPARFIGPEVFAAVYRVLAEEAAIPVCLHLDHCDDVDFCKRCADAGYTNIMIDASKQPFEENVRQTREVVEYCHALGDITVEGELGTVAGVEDQVKVTEDEAQLCDPQQALEFVDRTGVDIFAPSIGTAHGVYKTADPVIHFDRFQAINETINGRGVRTPLVVHGGTGLKPEVVRRLVALGGAKYNVSTDLKHVMLDAVCDYIDTHRGEYNPGRIDQAFKSATMVRIHEWIQLLGSSTRA